MKIRTAITMAMLILSWHVPLSAQQQQGDVALQFTGSMLSTLGETVTVTFGVVQGKVGYFFTDRVELAVSPTVVFARTTVKVGGSSASVSDTRFGMGVSGSYSFLAADATTVPYVGAQFYRIDLTDEDETGWAGVNAGLKFFFTRTTAFDVGGNYLFSLGEGGGSLVLFQMGLSFLR